MKKVVAPVLSGIILIICLTFANGSIDDEEKEACELLKITNQELINEKYKISEAEWKFATNITDETNLFRMEANTVYAKYEQDIALRFKKFDISSFKNEDLKRQIKIIIDLGDSVLPNDKFNELKNAISNMESVYSKTKIPSYKDDKILFSLDPEITRVLGESQDPEELKYYWKNWYDNVGTKNKKDFFKYVELRNEAAQLNNFTSGAESWLDDYEDETFEGQVDSIMEQLMPLYNQLHGYVRFKLNEKYGNDIVDVSKPIPMHLLGNMWGQEWSEISKFLVPYSDSPNFDITDEMIRQNYTSKQMFEMGDAFFQSLNMTKLPQSFWDKSIIQKPTDGRDLVCHASAWDFANIGDVRIKQCSVVTMRDFITTHHELGHIQYFLQYQNQPITYRTGANPGFHEAVGDVLALSVSTPKHLKKIGLLKEDFVFDEHSIINQFLNTALSKFAFLPFAYVMDKFRWGVFRGEIKPEEANCEFWKMRVKYGGIEPAVTRTNKDFDITAKYHASADVEYLRYFVSFIIQFQFYKSACIKAGEFEEGNQNKILSNCDIYQSAEAGNAMKAMLELGASKPWPDAMEVMTGQRKMDASGILEYFKPLETWLIQKNKDLGVKVGWKDTDSK
ncbi:unnamed protein product [Diamesa serratosioi]